MCGIFGYVGSSGLMTDEVRTLIEHAEQRGRDSSGVIVYEADGYSVRKADRTITSLTRPSALSRLQLFVGHSRLITNGLADNQPVTRDGIVVIHNGIILNHESLWSEVRAERELEIDSEIIPVLLAEELKSEGVVADAAQRVLDRCQGMVACAIAIPALGQLVLFSNNGSLYVGQQRDGYVFASERFPLERLGCDAIDQVRQPRVLEIPTSRRPIITREESGRSQDLVPALILSGAEERLLEYPQPNLRRCAACILPETMPFITFDHSGVCNFCRNYQIRNQPRSQDELFDLVEPYRRKSGAECILPFSGGRDSCYALHLVVNELQMRPITYTYDWGMVTDLGRRNISRMSAELGVENIIVAADIVKKRRNIQRNLRAWLKSPHLGMISILTAGDKHFFRHVETVRRQTGISLNLWGINPLEVTHFKAGFLGIPPDFEERRVYSHGAMKQLRYQSLRFRAMLRSPGYFNRSLWDTLSGEYYRSFNEKTDYFHVFDYWRWDEATIESVLDDYCWERAPDTQATWRIGDGTAAFYNYVYYTVAGFTEHDTFRSNQIREGQLTREEAIDLVKVENAPRYANIRWYLDVVDVDFESAIRIVNAIPRHYER